MDQNRDDRGRFASGGSGQRFSRAAQEKRALMQKFQGTPGANQYEAPGRSQSTQTYGQSVLARAAAEHGISVARLQEIMQSTGAHSSGIHAATLGKRLPS